VGCGSSPRSLSPATDIWRPASPVECGRLSVSRRCAGLHGRLQAAPAPQRSRPSVSPPRAFRVRLLSPGFAHLPVRSAGPGSDAIENGMHPIHSPQGRHRTVRSRSLALRHGSCLLPLELRFNSRSDDVVFDASRDSDVIAIRWSSPVFPAPSNRIAHSAMDRSFFTLRLRDRRDSAASCCSPRTAGLRTTALAHSSNFRSLTDCVRPRVRNPGPWGRDSARGRFLRSTARMFALRADAARRLASWSLTRRGTTLSEEAGDMCL